MRKVEGGVMRPRRRVKTSSHSTAVSKQGHVDGAHNAAFVPTQTGESAAACTELQSAPGRPGMNDLSAEREACRQLMELDVQLQRMEGGGEEGQTDTDRKLKQKEILTSSSVVVCGEQTRQLTCMFLSVCVRVLGKQTGQIYVCLCWFCNHCLVSASPMGLFSAFVCFI